MGKRTGKDLEKGKATLVDLLGMEGARRECSRLVDLADAAVEPFGDKAGTLRDAVRFVVEGTSRAFSAKVDAGFV